MPAPALCGLERIAKDPVYSLAGKHALLNRALGLRTLVLDAADCRILALGVLTNDEHVDVFGGSACERTANARHEFHRPHIGVLVEFSSDRDQQPPKRNVVRNSRISDSPEIDR